MYAGYGFRDWEIGDVDVVKVDGVFHLFHLILPNHDYIAHAVSSDGLSWRRVKNALFVGDPGSWDDDMLWTMHVSPDPDEVGWWRMFYTGLSRRGQGRVQRVGLARSNDLYEWTKVEGNGFPLEANREHYESGLDEGRHWVSFRDPFFVDSEDGRWLLVAARSKQGPVIRRGCVGLMEEVAPGHFESRPPLHHPRRYDDVEVPVHLRLGDVHYLVGSIREDIKVHYWHADHFRGPYRNFSDNVLLPQGNYAVRVCKDGDRYLVWNFFFRDRSGSRIHQLPPPKELVTDDRRLRLRSFHRFDHEVHRRHTARELLPFTTVIGNPSAEISQGEYGSRIGSPNGYEVFAFSGRYTSFRLRFGLELSGSGKCGIAFRLDGNENGYYLSLDLLQGLAQIRAWGARQDGSMEQAFSYQQLQMASFESKGPGPYELELLTYGTYIELSVDGFVCLSLADDSFRRGMVGMYVESAELHIIEPLLEQLREPRGEEHDLIV